MCRSIVIIIIIRSRKWASTCSSDWWRLTMMMTRRCVDIYHVIRWAMAILSVEYYSVVLTRYAVSATRQRSERNCGQFLIGKPTRRRSSDKNRWWADGAAGRQSTNAINDYNHLSRSLVYAATITATAVSTAIIAVIPVGMWRMTGGGKVNLETRNHFIYSRLQNQLVKRNVVFME